MKLQRRCTTSDTSVIFLPSTIRYEKELHLISPASWQYRSRQVNWHLLRVKEREYKMTVNWVRSFLLKRCYRPLSSVPFPSSPWPSAWRWKQLAFLLLLQFFIFDWFSGTPRLCTESNKRSRSSCHLNWPSVNYSTPIRWTNFNVWVIYSTIVVWCMELTIFERVHHPYRDR